MAIMKSVEIMSDSTKSFEGAIENGVERTAKSVDNIRSAYVNSQSVVVKDGKVTAFRVNMNITFEVK